MADDSRHQQQSSPFHPAGSAGQPDLHFLPDADMPADLIESSVTSEGVTRGGARTIPDPLPMLGEADEA